MTEPHEFVITRAWGINDTAWLWQCVNHHYGKQYPACERHLTVFMRVPVYNRQRRLL